jgi:hypothetical protein
MTETRDNWFEWAGQSGVLLSLRTAPALSLSDSRQESGVPVQTFRKEVVRTGEYFKASDGISFKVTPAMLDHWALIFSQFTQAGNKVPVPLTHDDPGNPGNNRGWVKSMYRDGDSLFANMDLIGVDGPKLALTSDVSIFSPPEYTDGKGNKYLRPITHVALCTDPVIPGLKPFEAIAASLNTKGSSNMNKIAKALGLKEDASEEDILAAISKLSKSEKDLEAILSAKTTDLTAKVAALEEATKKTAALELSLNPKKPEPILLKLAGENRGTKLSALVAAARITPAVKDKLAKVFVDGDALALSLSRGDETFDQVVAALADNNPVELKELSGQQALELAGGPAKGTEKNAVQKNLAKRRAAAGIKD